MPLLNDNTVNWDEIYEEYNRKLYRPRYKTVISRNSLSDYDKKAVEYTFASSSPKDAIRRAEHVLSKSDRLSYYAKQYLYALATAAETDANYH